jgi:hypothetical protein
MILLPLVHAKVVVHPAINEEPSLTCVPRLIARLSSQHGSERLHLGSRIDGVPNNDDFIVAVAAFENKGKRCIAW